MITTEGTQANQVFASSWDQWLNSPAGKYVLNWEKNQYNQSVIDCFGFQALQIGTPQLSSLKENRIPNRFLMLTPESSDAHITNSSQIEYFLGLSNELPFANESFDLITLPHTLEFSENPHDVLREVNRILRPEGRIVISGFNPISLWGLRQKLGHLTGHPFLPIEGQFISHLRIKDWLKVLDFAIDRGRFGCYRFPSKGDYAKSRVDLMEKAGDRWWPVFGSVFILSAVKRIPGIKLIGRIQSKRAPLRSSLAPVTQNSSLDKRQSNIYD